jgi:hypothetical protein
MRNDRHIAPPITRIVERLTSRQREACRHFADAE